MTEDQFKKIIGLLSDILVKLDSLSGYPEQKPLEYGQQKKISEKSGYSESAVSMFINTQKRPTWAGAKKLSSAVPGTTPVLWLEGTKDEIKKAIKNAAQTESTQGDA